MEVVRLGREHVAGLRALLAQEPETNVFGLGLLEHGIDALLWYGTEGRAGLRCATLIFPGRLVVPFGPPEDAAAIGEVFRARYRPGMLVGPRAACDALWSAWAWAYGVRCWFDQRLLVVDSMPAAEPPGLRLADLDDLAVIAENQARMDHEDLGFSRADEDPAGHLGATRDRIESGRTWVLEERGRIVFQINVGVSSRWGAQVGGTWVAPETRGRGVGTRGMLAVRARLMRTHRRVTLHVREGNAAALTCYERAGWRWATAFRLGVAAGPAPA